MSFILRHRLLFFFLAALFGGIAFASPVHAGFEWTPPPEEPKKIMHSPEKVSVSVPDMPLAKPVLMVAEEPLSMPLELAPSEDSVKSEPLQPINMPLARPGEEIIWSMPHDMGDMHSMEHMSSDAPAALFPMPMPVHHSAPSIPAFKARGPKTEAFHGFGRDIPLAMAIGQIAPPSYAYVFDPSVDPAVMLSWDGGESWERVLRSALAEHQLEPSVSGTTIYIRPLPASALAHQPDHHMESGRMAHKKPHTLPPFMMKKADVFPRAEKMPVSDAPVSYSVKGHEKKERVGTPVALREFGQPKTVPKEDIMWNVVAPTVPAPVSEPKVSETQMKEPATQKTIPPAVEEKVTFIAPSWRDSVEKVMDPLAIRFWQAAPGHSLRATLAAWSRQGQVKLVWESPRDYMLSKPLLLHGTFAEAVTAALEAGGKNANQPYGKLHPNLPHGPSVLVVRSGAES